VTVFADTSALYAILDRDDGNHAAAAAIWSAILDADTRTVTTNYSIVETSALVQRRLGLTALRVFHEDICPLLDVDWITADRHDAAIQAVLAASRRKLSLVDCVSFDSARRLGIRDAFSFDAHFREHGLRLISVRDIT
jgi:predicted nucleic acid-binding protein